MHISSYVIRIIIIIIVVVMVALIGSFISRKGISWLYSNNVIRSPHMPPNWAFGIVWTLLYIMYIYVWCDSPSHDLLFAISIILNLLWVILFFGVHDIMLSRVIIVILLLVVLYQVCVMWQENRALNAFLLLIYVSWLVCATGLNFETRLRHY